jgi:hypothetical protein
LFFIVALLGIAVVLSTFAAFVVAGGDAVLLLLLFKVVARVVGFCVAFVGCVDGGGGWGMAVVGGNWVEVAFTFEEVGAGGEMGGVMVVVLVAFMDVEVRSMQYVEPLSSVYLSFTVYFSLHAHRPSTVPVLPSSMQLAFGGHSFDFSELDFSGSHFKTVNENKIDTINQR